MDINYLHRESYFEKLINSANVDKKLLHRVHNSEVFLNKCTATNQNNYLTLAIIPDDHEYYLDHIDTTILDILLLLECARQAETYIAHTYYDIPLSGKFILNNWSLSCFNKSTRTINDQFILNVQVYDTKKIKDKVYRQKYKIDIFYADTQIATVNMDASYVSNAKYEKIRGDKKSMIAHFDEFKRKKKINDITPEQVLRTKYKNVVISTPQIENGKISVLLNIDFNNISLFDHPQDHYPAMVLVEAGRQLSLFYLTKNKNNILTLNKGIKSNFFSYAEFDSEVFLIVVENTLNVNEINIEVVQNDKLVANLTYTFNE